MTLELRVGQFGIVDHEPVEQSPNAGIFMGKGPSEDRAECFLLAEAATPAGEGFAGHLVSTLGQRWTTLDQSLTGSILTLYREAHQIVHDWNARSMPEHRVEVGLGCFVRRGPHSIVATGGPSILFHYSAGRCRAYYPNDPHAEPLGESMTEPQIRRVPLAPGDRLLMVSSAALAAIEPALIADILALEPDRILPELYRRIAEMRYVTVMLLVAPDEHEDQSPRDDQQAPVAAPFTEAGPGEVRIGEPEPAYAVPAGNAPHRRTQAARQQLDAVSRRARMRVIAPRESAAAPMPVMLRRASGDESLRRLTAASEVARARDSAQPLRGRSFSTGLVRSPQPPQAHAAASAAAPLAEDAAREVTARHGQRRYIPDPAPAGPEPQPRAQTIVRVRRNAGARMRSSGTLSRHTGIRSLPLPPWALAAIGAVALVVLAAALTLPDLLESDDSSRYLALVDDAQTHYAAAQSAERPGVRRTELTEARELLLQAQESGSAGSEVTNLLDRVRDELATMDAVTTPRSVEPIGSLAEFGDSPVTVSDAVIGSEQAYLLDDNGEEVIAMNLADGSAQPVYLAEPEEGGRARPARLVPDPAGGADTVLILDVAGGLWSYSPGTGLRELDIALPAQGAFTDLAVDGDSLFVLDAQNAVIYRYARSGSGFGSPEPVVEDPGLATASRFTVRGDDIVVSQQDGSLRWHSLGEDNLVLDLQLGGIDTPLVSPERPVLLDAEAGEWGIIDPARSRVVVFELDGTFVRQYQDTSFDGIAALAVTPDGSFVYSNDALHRVAWTGEDGAAEPTGTEEPTLEITQE